MDKIGIIAVILAIIILVMGLVCADTVVISGGSTDACIINSPEVNSCFSQLIPSGGSPVTVPGTNPITNVIPIKEQKNPFSIAGIEFNSINLILAGLMSFLILIIILLFTRKNRYLFLLFKRKKDEDTKKQV